MLLLSRGQRSEGQDPAFTEIAARNKGKAQAIATLAASVRKGRHGDGPWHMPPHPRSPRRTPS